jgi:uncharacterized membrane protein
MKKVITFIKATVFGGLFAVLPVFLLITILAKIVIGARSAAQSLIEKLAGDSAETVEFPLVYAVLLVVLISFLLGLAMMSRPGASCGSWMNRSILSRIPGYSTIRAVLGGFRTSEEEGTLKVGLLSMSEDTKCFVFITEDHGNGWLTVFAPETPNPGTGTVQIVAKVLVEPLNLRLGEISKSLHQWGIGSAKLLEKHAIRSMGSTDIRTSNGTEANHPTSN